MCFHPEKFIRFIMIIIFFSPPTLNMLTTPFVWKGLWIYIFCYNFIGIKGNSKHFFLHCFGNSRIPNCVSVRNTEFPSLVGNWGKRILIKVIVGKQNSILDLYIENSTDVSMNKIFVHRTFVLLFLGFQLLFQFFHHFLGFILLFDQSTVTMKWKDFYYRTGCESFFSSSF